MRVFKVLKLIAHANWYKYLAHTFQTSPEYFVFCRFCKYVGDCCAEKLLMLCQSEFENSSVNRTSPEIRDI